MKYTSKFKKLSVGKVVLLSFLASVVAISLLLLCQFRLGKFAGKQPVVRKASMNTEEKIQLLLPKGSFLRDYQKLEDVELESLLVIYISDGYEFNRLDLSCPAYILGESVRGDYRLALVQSGEIVDSVDIPTAYDYSEEESLELKYKDIWGNVGIEDSNTPTNADFIDTSSFPVEKLLDLKDYTGDGKAYEFLLITTAGGCGFFDGLVGGYDPGKNKVALYSNWISRFSPDENGKFYDIFRCGDHGNMTETEVRYEFIEGKKKFEKVWEKRVECTV